jgi:WD40 repeat protein
MHRTQRHHSLTLSAFALLLSIATTASADPPACRVKEASDRLDAHGDPLPPHALLRLGTVRLRDPYPQGSMALSPDGKIVATGGMDRTIRFWDVATAKEVRQLHEDDSILGLDFSPDGKTLATMGRRTSLWDVAKGETIKQFHVAAQALVFSPDGKLLATSTQFGKVQIWDVVTTKELQSWDSEIQGHVDLRFFPGGKTLAIVPRWGNKDLQLWDRTTPKRLRARELSNVLITDGKLAAGTTMDSGEHSCRVWHLATGRELRRLKTGKKSFRPLAFAPDGSHLALSEFGKPAPRLVLWPLTGRQTLRELAGDTGYAAMAVFSADGAVLATMNFDQVIRLWDVKTGKQLHSFPGHTAPVALLAFSAEGQTLTSVGENHVICQWDATGKLLHQFDRRESGERPLAFTRDLKLLVARPQVQEPRLVDVKTGKTVRQLGIDVDGNILLSPDERWLVEGLDSIRTWDLARTKLVWEKGSATEPRIRAAGFSPDGSTLATIQNGTVQLRQSATGKEIRRIAIRGTLSRLAFSPDGETIAVTGKVIHLFDRASGKLIRELAGNDDDHLLFSPNGTLLASVHHGDNSIAVWETTTGKKLAEFHGHRSPIQCLAFSQDSRRLASGSYDTTVLVWDLSSAK